MKPQSELELEELKLDDLRGENERLRNARASVTRQLGPLPISAAIVAGLVTGFSGDGKVHLNHTLAIWALSAFGAMVLVSILSSAYAPYRKLRERAEQRRSGEKPSDAPDRTTWYARMIAIEEEVRSGPPGSGPNRVLALWPLRRARSLQDGFEQEWRGLFATKLLFVAVIVLLILARGIG